MSFFGIISTDKRGLRPKGSDDSEILMGEFYDKAKNDLQLLLIYKKLEVAARVGDWELMNQLNSEFKSVEASRHEQALNLIRV